MYIPKNTTASSRHGFDDGEGLFTTTGTAFLFRTWYRLQTSHVQKFHTLCRVFSTWKAARRRECYSLPGPCTLMIAGHMTTSRASAARYDPRDHQSDMVSQNVTTV